MSILVGFGVQCARRCGGAAAAGICGLAARQAKVLAPGMAVLTVCWTEP